MPRRRKHLLPNRCGYCIRCGKDSYPDEIGAELALQALRRNPPRGRREPIRFYACPSGRGFHLTSEEQHTGIDHPVSS